MYACKKALSVSQKTPNAMIYGELGRYPLYINTVMKSEKYWLKQRLLDHNARDWHDKTSTKVRFKNCRGFKHILQFESYLSDLTVKTYRDATVQIRLGVNDLTCSKYEYITQTSVNDYVRFVSRRGRMKTTSGLPAERITI